MLELAREWRTQHGSGGEDTVDFLTGMIRFSRKEFVEAAELFSVFVLSPAQFGVALLLALRKVFLRIAWETCPPFLCFLRPELRRINGRLCSRFGRLSYLTTGLRIGRCGVAPAGASSARG